MKVTVSGCYGLCQAAAQVPLVWECRGQPTPQRRWQRARRSCCDHGIELFPPLQSLKEEARLLGKMTIASKLLTNRRVRQAAVELLKNPRADKSALATKLITNRKVREGAVELLKDSSVRTMLLQQATQRFRRP